MGDSMTLLDFLRRVLPDSGSYFYSYITKQGDWRDKKVANLDKLVERIEWSDSSQMDTYFATGSYGDEKGRVGTNVVGKCVWYLDIDCKPDGTGQYLSKKEGLKAIKAAKSKGLPTPVFMSDSGNGWHLYYVTKEAVGTTQWLNLAEALVALCEAIGLNIDSKVSKDVTRVLRAPTTRNWKDREHPRDCKVVSHLDDNYSLENWVATLQPYLSAPTALPTAAPIEEPSDLEGGMEGMQAHAPLMLQQCPLMHAMHQHNGATEPGVVWHKVLHTLAFCEDGHDYIHEVSRAHPEYDIDETERKFAWSHRKKATDSIGPTSCEKFKEASDDSHCSTCRFNGRIKSPIVLGYREWSDFPVGYKNEDGKLWRWNGEGFDLICAEQFTACELADVDGALCARVTVSGDTVTFDLDALNENRRMQDVFSPRAIMFHDAQVKAVRDFLMSWVKQLRDTRRVTNTTTRFGWREDGFAVGSDIYMDSGTTVKSFQRDPTYSSYYTAKGDPDKWQAAADFIMANSHPAIQCTVLSAFAAPLMTFTGQPGALLAVISQESGTGKTSAMRVAQAVWGDPIHGIGALNDTGNAMEHRMGVVNNLPMYWDEIRGHQQTQDFVRILFRITQGREKQRLNATIQARGSGVWQTMMVCASNENILGYVKLHAGGSNAGALRVLELEAPEIKANYDAQKLLAPLTSNYGHIGVRYASWLAQNRQEAERLTHLFTDKVNTVLKPEANERFWVAISAAILAGGYIAKQLGYLQVDVLALFRYLVTTMRSMRTVVSEDFKTGKDAAVDFVQEFIQGHVDHGVWSDKLPGRGKNNTGNPHSVAERAPPYFRFGNHEARVAVSLKQFTNWMAKMHKGTSPTNVVQRLRNMGAARQRVTLEAGTYRGGTREWTLIIDYNDPQFDSLANESGHSSDPEALDSSTEPPPL